MSVHEHVAHTSTLCVRPLIYAVRSRRHNKKHERTEEEIVARKMHKENEKKKKQKLHIQLM
jgi:hypothetical protein